MKKIYIAFIALIFSISANAQSQAGKSLALIENSSASKSEGLILGVIFSRLSDSELKYTNKTVENGVVGEFEANGSSSVSMYGVSLGYKNNYEFYNRFGYSFAFSFMGGNTGDELARNYMTIYKIQGDIVVPFTEMFNFSIGANASYMSMTNKIYDYDPSLGAQAGLQINLGGANLLVGYQALGVTARGIKAPLYEGATASNSNYQSQSANGTVAGFITQLGYTF